MNITTVKIYELNKDKLKAFASITLDEEFVVTGLKVLEGNNGYFVGMPSRKNTKPDDGTKDYKAYIDTVYPVSKASRNELQNTVLQAYHDYMESNEETHRMDAVVEVVEKRGTIDVLESDLPF